MFERFTDRARQVVVLSEEEARSLNQDHIGTEHILLALIREGHGVAAQALGSLGISLDAVRTQVEEANEPGQHADGIAEPGQYPPSQHLQFTPRAQKVLELSLREALVLGHDYIGTEHILLGLIREAESAAAQVLARLGADLDQVRQRVFDLLPGGQGPVTAAGRPLAASVVLDQFGQNLTAAARGGRLDPVIGREAEIERVMQVLSRRTRNNPVLVGEPGVDKIAVAQGLALKIAKGEVPGKLTDKELYTLDLDVFADGSPGAGGVEERLAQVQAEIRARRDIILFIDEIHGLVSAPAAGGGSPILKQMLARGEMQAIGATTLDDYQKYLEKDAALERTLQPIPVAEPTIAHTIEILKGLRDRYESHHRISITDAALVAAAQLADRYVSDSFLPGKAIDLIDEAGSLGGTRRMVPPPDLRDFDEKIDAVRREKESAIDSQDFEKAAALRDHEKQLAAKKAAREKEWKADYLSVVAVDEDLIFEAVARVTGMSVPRLRSLETRFSASAPDEEDRDQGDQQSYVLLNDQPVDGADGDLLGTADIAAGIAAMLVASRAASPFVLAVDGSWGIGKSTLLRQIDSQLSGRSDIVRVRFNAWTAEGGNALEGLIKSVLGELDRNVVRRWVRRQAKRRRLVGAARLGSALAGRFFGVTRLVDELWSQLAVDAKSRNDMRDLIQGMLADWVQRSDARHSGRALVVFIDDLDRCSDDVVLKVCEAVKLYLDAPGLIFVIACDLSVLARSTAASARGGVSEGRAYLEKIVQVAHRVPPPEESQIRRLISGYGTRSGTAALIDETVMGILTERAGRNPRKIKRIINSFVLEHQLNPAWRRAPLDSAQLVTAILLQHLYTPFYDRLVSEEAGDDPIGEFLDYAKVRAKAPNPPGSDNAWWSVVRRTFQEHDMPVPDRSPSAGEKLISDIERLERGLPEDFPALARSNAFIALLSGIGDKNTRMALRSQLVSRPLGTQVALDDAPTAA
jgi:KAP family P-loop domain/AAA lid domain/Clp amino terminal domain, pathogenicity island component